MANADITRAVLDGYSGPQQHSNIEQVASEPSSEGEQFTTISKARHKRRLQNRWRCRTDGHSYCITDTDFCHVPITEENLVKWVDAMHDGYATLLTPPTSIILSTSDAYSVGSNVSKNSIIYQKPFHFQLNPSLSDLRSWRSSASSTSSGNPGPGYLSGKAIKWVGNKIIDSITPLEIRRQMWLIERFIKHLEKEPEETRWKWLLKKEKSYNRFVDALLELSSDEYKQKYREVSIANGSRINNSLVQSNYHDEGAYWLLSARICPLLFLGEDRESIDSMGVGVREILLQGSLEASDMDHMVSKLLVCACNELTHGAFTKSRRNAYELIHQLYFIPAGARELERLGRPGGLLDNLAKQVFDSGFDSEDFREKWSGIMFFAEYADDNPAYRKYALGPNGLGLDSQAKIFGPANGQVLPASSDWARISWPCRTIGRISDMPWVIPTLLNLDICQASISLLFSHQLSGRPDARIDYSIIRTFYNLISFGDNSARQAVQEALTVDARNVLCNLRDGV